MSKEPATKNDVERNAVMRFLMTLLVVCLIVMTAWRDLSDRLSRIEQALHVEDKRP